MGKTRARNVLITGVSRGLGQAMVMEFAAAGHTVYGCARSTKSVVDLRNRFGQPHRFDVVDVSHDGVVQAWAESILQSGFVPELLLNNAAVVNANAPLWEVPAAEFDQVIDVNIKGVVNVIRHFVPAMIARQQGIIVNFSSGWGRSTSPEVAPYCATKWAIEGLSFALSQELPRGMAAVPLNPGIINTDMLQSCFGENAAGYPDPENWARRAVPYLLSLGPKHNGEALSVPGA